MNVPPASGPCPADAAERSEAATAAAPQGSPFPWLEDTTGNQVKPPSWKWLPPSVSVGPIDSLAHEVIVIMKPSVGKAVAVWRPFLSPLQAMREQRARSLVDPSTGKLVDPETGEYIRSSLWDALSDEERLAECVARANSRAASEMADFMVHNRLVKMWVLTFRGDGLHGVDGRAEAMRRVAAFMKRLRRDFFRGKPFPYCYSPELHPDGHGWHVNLFLRSVYIDKHALQRCWGQGNVYYTDFTTDRYVKYTGRRIGAVRAGVASGSARGARKAARYASKYAQKDWATEAIGANAHRYERAQGFNVPEQRIRVRSFDDFLRLVQAHPACGKVFTDWVLDDSTPGWMGPPMRGVLFDHGSAPSRRDAHSGGLPERSSARGPASTPEPHVVRAVDLAVTAPAHRSP